MTPKLMRLIGIFFFVDAAIIAVLNLKRVANLGLPWLSTLFLLIGLIFVVIARRQSDRANRM
ncbi:MAG: hypothetical protein ABR577_15305 [Pyrinomonadaceae bacterium]